MTLSKILAISGVCASLLLTTIPAVAGLDIVKSGVSWVVTNDSGKVIGTFWNPNDGATDFGFESSIVPDFVWSKDRDYVAVIGGAPRSRATSLYKVAGNSLKPIEVPYLSDDQAAPLNEIINSVADGIDGIRWQPDGTLLLRFWSAQAVTSDTEKQKEASVWADLEVNDLQAKIVGTSSAEPSTPPAGKKLASPQAGDANRPVVAPSFPEKRLIGIHNVVGKNPDGSTYKGTVKIRVVNGVVGLEWKVAGSLSHGQGVLVGATLGIALDDGIAVYILYGQSEGQSLIGVWSSSGSSVVNEEAILIGNPDMTQASVKAEKINGQYMLLRETPEGQVEGKFSISGGEIAKKAVWSVSGQTAECQGLALSDGFAVLTPDGISVYEKHLDNDGGASLVGSALSRGGEVQSESLSPAN
jgi:hypothetical protein